MGNRPWWHVQEALHRGGRSSVASSVAARLRRRAGGAERRQLCLPTLHGSAGGGQ